MFYKIGVLENLANWKKLHSFQMFTLNVIEFLEWIYFAKEY